MTKSDLTARLVEICPYMTIRNADKIVSIVVNSIVSSLKSGARVELRGFGSFCVRERKSMEGRNPRTGEKILMSKKFVPFFKAGKPLKKMVNASASAGISADCKLQHSLRNSGGDRIAVKSVEE
ncbi:MAG: integration host factor subunit beta [Holosporaceae bacterium]|jgi:integration host factor subunit beta|nr:integration host factor subunit beta [Holosporaceae bacterium]